MACILKDIQGRDRIVFNVFCIQRDVYMGIFTEKIIIEWTMFSYDGLFSLFLSFPLMHENRINSMFLCREVFFSKLPLTTHPHECVEPHTLQTQFIQHDPHPYNVRYQPYPTYQPYPQFQQQDPDLC